MNENWRDSDSGLVLAACLMGSLMYLMLGDFHAALGFMDGYVVGLFFWWVQTQRTEAWHRDWSTISPAEKPELRKAA